MAFPPSLRPNPVPSESATTKSALPPIPITNRGGSGSTNNGKNALPAAGKPNALSSLFPPRNAPLPPMPAPASKSGSTQVPAPTVSSISPTPTTMSGPKTNVNVHNQNIHRQDPNAPAPFQGSNNTSSKNNNSNDSSSNRNNGNQNNTRNAAVNGDAGVSKRRSVFGPGTRILPVNPTLPGRKQTGPASIRPAPPAGRQTTNIPINNTTSAPSNQPDKAEPLRMKDVAPNHLRPSQNGPVPLQTKSEPPKTKEDVPDHLKSSQKKALPLQTKPPLRRAPPMESLIDRVNSSHSFTGVNSKPVSSTPHSNEKITINITNWGKTVQRYALFLDIGPYGDNLHQHLLAEVTLPAREMKTYVLYKLFWGWAGVAKKGQKPMENERLVSHKPVNMDDNKGRVLDSDKTDGTWSLDRPTTLSKLHGREAKISQVQIRIRTDFWNQFPASAEQRVGLAMKIREKISPPPPSRPQQQSKQHHESDGKGEIVPVITMKMPVNAGKDKKKKKTAKILYPVSDLCLYVCRVDIKRSLEPGVVIENSESGSGLFPRTPVANMMVPWITKATVVDDGTRLSCS